MLHEHPPKEEYQHHDKREDTICSTNTVHTQDINNTTAEDKAGANQAVFDFLMNFSIF